MSKIEANSIAFQAVEEIEKCLREIESERGSYMQRCKGIRDRIKDWKDRAHEDGTARKAMNAFLKERDLTRKLAALNDDLEEDDADQVQILRDRFGPAADLGMFAAAVERAEQAEASKPKGRGGRKAKAKGDALNSLIDDTPPSEDETDVRPPFLRDKDAAAAEANTSALEAGLKQLPN